MHFLVLGAALFGLYRLLNGADATPTQSIVVSEARVEALAENFAKTWMRAPGAAELKGLVDDYVAEEVYYREAVAMGLDRDDTVIRRRLRQKMEFVTDDLAGAVPATDAQLQQYLDAHRDRFLQPPLVSFEQVFLSPERRGESVVRDAERLLADLRRQAPGTPVKNVGDATLLPADLESATPQDIENTFGTDFAADVADAPVGQWSGPVRSGYGLHLVRVTTRQAGAVPTLDAVRPLVQREWEAQQRQQAKQALLAQLLAKYEVRIEVPLGEAIRAAGQPVPAATQP